MSDYNQFWFVETRVQTNNLKRWFLWAILIFLFVGIGTYVCVRSMYQPITDYEIQTQNPVIKVEVAKRTNVNGYIKGSITNIEESEMKGKYIEFTFYTENGIEIGKEHVEVGSIESKQTKTYEVNFRYPNVKRFIVTINDSK